MTAKEKRALVRRVKETHELLLEFGVRSFAYDPGVVGITFAEFGSQTINFNGTQWRWLEPLLKELRELRGKREENEERR